MKAKSFPWMGWLAALGLAGVLLVVLWMGMPQRTVVQAMSPASPDEATPRTLTVTGTGEVSLTPDLAHVTLAVETRNRDLSKALRENNQRTEQVIAALRQHKVAAEDIHTANFSVRQDQHYDDQGNLILGPYTVTNSLVVTVRDLNALGAILNDALAAGANRMDALTFGSSQVEAARLEAKLAAVAAARHQAEAIAQAAGVTLEAVQTITFGYAPPLRAATYKADAMAAGQQVPVSPGEMTITATVTMVFLIH